MTSPNRFLSGALAVTLLMVFAAGCAQSNGDDAAGARMVFVCTETGTVIEGRPQPTPAVNPDTGRKTLQPGLYCAACKKWNPSAPLDVAQRHPEARLCPKHRTPMDTKGPL